MRTKRSCPDCCRIVLTGGPGGGKTTAADLFRREIGERVVIVPEAATILFQGGFPRSREPRASQFAQTTIFHVQRNLEDVQAALYPGRTLHCDRGTVDDAAYWPGTAHDYFSAVGTTLEAELRRLRRRQLFRDRGSRRPLGARRSVGFLRWLSGVKRAPRRIFLIHGEDDGLRGLETEIQKRFGWPTHIPAYLETVELA